MSLAIESRPILPGTFRTTEKAPSPGRRTFHMVGPVDDFSDRDLLDYCGYSPFLGGSVQRTSYSDTGERVAIVWVYTD